MSFWAYMLHCRAGVFYTGHTDNLEQRMAQHHSGQIPGFTSDKLPVTLVWSQDFPTRLEALEAERRIKGWSRAKKLALIRGDWDRISALAKKKNHPSTSSGRTEEGKMPELKTIRPELVEGSSLLEYQPTTLDPVTNPSPSPVRPEPVEGPSLLAHNLHNPVRPELVGAEGGAQPLRPLLLQLTPHPDTPPLQPVTLTVELTQAPNQSALHLRYTLTGNPEATALPPPQTPERGHELWLHTCFEAFVRVPDEEHYREYNFAPSRQWAMYRLIGYREGLAEVHDAPEPEVSVTQSADSFILETTIHPDLSRGALIALTAVIEETDGTKSYWSLRHPPGEPDFHHPDCFALALEAPQTA